MKKMFISVMLLTMTVTSGCSFFNNDTDKSDNTDKSSKVAKSKKHNNKKKKNKDEKEKSTKEKKNTEPQDVAQSGAATTSNENQKTEVSTRETTPAETPIGLDEAISILYRSKFSQIVEADNYSNDGGTYMYLKGQPSSEKTIVYGYSGTWGIDSFTLVPKGNQVQIEWDSGSRQGGGFTQIQDPQYDVVSRT
ncbi:hypothetical protein RD055328_00330 [Companilactobacillus sp. RD055328]|uniref:hypothetical protein n=1 Tax=Companilactobacillus sp. RD055328 TaxID=2916634 RepID=UPI001FC8E869|nr:hypothetical protein [Companilactobacillus sp. RD055328]GKQ42110.1 hypothetical protein RD055328_00330 [Companilactobacillus sp. RD055328]